MPQPTTLADWRRRATLTRRAADTQRRDETAAVLHRRASAAVLDAATVVIAADRCGEPQPISRDPAPTTEIANTGRALVGRRAPSWNQPLRRPSPPQSRRPVPARNAQRRPSADARGLASKSTCGPTWSRRHEQGAASRTERMRRRRANEVTQRTADRTTSTATPAPRRDRSWPRSSCSRGSTSRLRHDRASSPGSRNPPDLAR